MPKTTTQKEHIARTALKLFAKHGYGSTSIRLIANTAKVSSGLLYAYFKNKEDLLKAIVNHGFDDIKRSMTIYDDKNLPPQKAIEIHVNATFNIIRQNSEFWRLLHSIRLQEKVLHASRKNLNAIVRYITSAFTSIFKDLGYKNPGLEAVLFLTQIDGLVILYLQDSSIPLNKLSQQIIQRYTR